MVPSSTLRNGASKLTWIGALAGGLLLSLLLSIVAFSEHSSAQVTTSGLIKHVVIIDMENHSFDNVLGQLCIQDHRPNCDAASQGKLSDGTTINLQPAADLVPSVNHDNAAQDTAINGGKMNGFNKIGGCGSSGGYRCYSQFYPDQIPNTAALARQFAISDHTFEQHSIPSWGSHMILAASQLDGFRGNNPYTVDGVTPGPGWGCNSNKLASWRASSSDSWQGVPSCIPDQNGNGPFEASPVTWKATIFDRMDDAHMTWKIYTANPTGSKSTTPTTKDPAHGTGYIWAMCPYFADCLYTNQANNMVQTDNLITDAQAGTLPDVSFAIPEDSNSQHNGFSMQQGENWINKLVTPLMWKLNPDGTPTTTTAPEWSSTAIFLMWDDCGCFYDHVNPLTQTLPPKSPKLGIRIPMIIISPYAKSGYTDNSVASMSSPLAFIEHNFGLAPLSNADTYAYDYSNSFDTTQSQVGPVKLSSQTIPKKERNYIRTHPVHDSEM